MVKSVAPQNTLSVCQTGFLGWVLEGGGLFRTSWVKIRCAVELRFSVVTVYSKIAEYGQQMPFNLSNVNSLRRCHGSCYRHVLAARNAGFGWWCSLQVLKRDLVGDLKTQSQEVTSRQFAKIG